MAQKASDIIAQMKSVMGPDTSEKGDYDEENKVDFPIPDGYELPSGTKPGDEFTAVGTFRLDEDGDLCLTKLEGIPVSAEAELPEPQSGGSPGGMEVAKQSEGSPY